MLKYIVISVVTLSLTLLAFVWSPIIIAPIDQYFAERKTKNAINTSTQFQIEEEAKETEKLNQALLDVEILTALKNGNTKFQYPYPKERLMIMAARIGRFDVIESLIKQGISINTEIEEFGTVLMDAIAHRKINTVKELINMGADVNQLITTKTIFGDATYKPLDFTIKEPEEDTPETLAEKAEIIQILIDAGADFRLPSIDPSRTIFFTYASLANHEAVKVLIDAGADVNTRNYQHTTPLMYTGFGHPSSKSKNLEKTYTLLLEAGADINARDINGDTAFMYTAGFNNPASIDILAKLGADIHARDNDGRTALHKAARIGYRNEQIHKLLDLGLDINAQDNDGYTPLMLSNSENVKIFLQAGADTSIKNNKGQTALQQAEEQEKELSYKTGKDLVIRVFLNSK